MLKLLRSSRPQADPVPLGAELARRMAQPQRHRLLQGYPMAPMMGRVASGFAPLLMGPRDPARPLLVGVLPHASCNPAVQGCGFCTFPHETFEKSRVLLVVERVIAELQQQVRLVPELAQREVAGVYLGGGTANLTPPDALARLLQALARAFELGRAELTLEGVPRYFLTREARQLDLLAEAPVRHRRISMGVQSFDPAWLQRMGRSAFGDRAVVAEVVAAAHQRGMTTSVDLLYNLPGQDLQEAQADVRAAVELGADQICLYNLVLTRELGTVWASDEALLQAMPTVERACETWLALREALLAQGYVQTTLTNFERADLPLDKRFAYELASFEPATYDALGLGPAAISTFTAPTRRYAMKWINRTTSEAYLAEPQPAATIFQYLAEDLRLLHLTRGLSRLAIDRAAFQAFFAEDPVAWLGSRAEILRAADLIEVQPHQIALTPRGMFYADSVAGLIAHTRVLALRQQADDADGRKNPMG
jgi:coproporphyrinogen III oxidase-like Fe-S oxidoreductase